MLHCNNLNLDTNCPGVNEKIVRCTKSLCGALKLKKIRKNRLT